MHIMTILVGFFGIGVIIAAIIAGQNDLAF